MINYTTEKEKRLKTAKNAFSRRNKKDRQRRGEASGQNQLKSKKQKSNISSGGGTRTRVNLVMSQDWNHLQPRRNDNDTAKIQPFIGCRKSNEQKYLFFYFSFFS